MHIIKYSDDIYNFTFYLVNSTDKNMSLKIDSLLEGFYCIRSEKKFPYGSFFLCTKTFGHNTIRIALHVMNMDYFNFVNYKITNKNNGLNLMDKFHRQ